MPSHTHGKQVPICFYSVFRHPYLYNITRHKNVVSNILVKFCPSLHITKRLTVSQILQQDVAVTTMYDIIAALHLHDE